MVASPFARATRCSREPMRSACPHAHPHPRVSAGAKELGSRAGAIGDVSAAMCKAYRGKSRVQCDAHYRRVRWEVLCFKGSVRDCAWGQGPPRSCRPAQTQRNAESGTKDKASSGLKDPSWLLDQLVAMFRQDDGHNGVAQQPKQIAEQTNETETLQTKQDEEKRERLTTPKKEYMEGLADLHATGMQEFEDAEEGDKQGSSAVTPRTSAPLVAGGDPTPAESVAAIRGAMSTMRKAKASGHPQVTPTSKKQKAEEGGCS